MVQLSLALMLDFYERYFEMPHLLLPLVSMIATVGAGLLFVRKAANWGFIDVPDPRKVHTLPTPRTGGLAMLLGGGLTFGLATFMGWVPWPSIPWQTWLAGLGFATVGTLDDRYSFYPRQKFLIMLALSALAAWPWLLVFKASGAPWLPQAWVSAPLTLSGVALLLTFWFMAVPNAVNIEDAINGYMGGFTFIVLGGLALLGVDSRLAMGALLGFLLLNWPKAKHFMGDAGSFGCGFFIAEAILRGGGLANPVLALALTAPISMDVAMGLIRRKRLGMSPFTADRATCPHHLLVRFGGSHLLATLVLWANVAVIFLLLDHCIMLGAWILCYAGVLVWLNRVPLTKAQPS